MKVLLVGTIYKAGVALKAESADVTLQVVVLELGLEVETRKSVSIEGERFGNMQNTCNVRGHRRSGWCCVADIGKT